MNLFRQVGATSLLGLASISQAILPSAIKLLMADLVCVVCDHMRGNHMRERTLSERDERIGCE
jgi:hypothetical protein